MLNRLFKRPGVTTSQTIADKAAIEELAAFERFCRDNEQWAEMKKCYATDAVVNTSWYQGSAQEFIDASSNNQVAPAQHQIHNTLVWLHGDRAVAIMMASIQIPAEIKNIPLKLVAETKLLYRLKKVQGLWLITQFDCIYVQDSLTPKHPTTELNIPTSAFAGFRQSYACISYNAQYTGTKIDNNLPGTDRPDLVNKLYQDADDWLSGVPSQEA